MSIKRYMLFLCSAFLWIATAPQAALAREPGWTSNPDTTPVNIRIAHFSPDSPALALLVDQRPSKLEEVAFTTISAWHTLPAGSHMLTFVNPINATNVISTELQFSEGSWTTLALIGSLERHTLRLHTITHDYSEIPEGEVRLSIFHAIEGTPALDLQTNNNALFQFINYPNTDPNLPNNDGFASTRVVSNTYTLTIVANAAQETFLNLGEITLLSGHIYFIAIVGIPSQPTFLLVMEDKSAVHSSPKPDLRILEPIEAGRKLRVAHFASGTPAVDVYLDNQLSSIQRLDYSEVTDFKDLYPAVSSVTIVRHGQGLTGTLIPELNVGGVRSEWLTIAIIGSVENDTLAAVLLEEDFNHLEPLNARISVFQAIPGIPPVDVTVDGTVRIRLLGYPGSQGNNDGYESFDVLEGTHEIQVVSSANPDEIVFQLPQQNFLAGRNYLLATIRAEPPYILAFTEITTP